MAFVGPAAVALLGLGAVLAAGFRPINTILLVVGSALTAVVLWDFPLHTVIGPEGVARRCLLRTERIEWSRIRSIARPGKSSDFAGGRQPLGARGKKGQPSMPGPDVVTAPGSGSGGKRSSRTKNGLVAEIGKRPFMLADRIESGPEYDALAASLKVWAPNVILRATRPRDGLPPTWLYKRRKGDGEGLADRLS